MTSAIESRQYWELEDGSVVKVKQRNTYDNGWLVIGVSKDGAALGPCSVSDCKFKRLLCFDEVISKADELAKKRNRKIFKD